jgi:acyl-CoA thioester hydrolase
MEDSGIIMPVRSMSFRFIKAALYDDLLKITVQIVGEPNVRCDFKYQIFNQHQVHLADATTEMFFVNKETMRPMRLPEKFINSFK